MADFFFFTDIDLLNEQQQPQAFGPAGTSGGMDVFNVTSKHTATADPNAYAVCKGIVCIQSDTGNADLVNLILKPVNQPGFDFPRIKYIIYRGLLKDQLITGSEIAAKTNNDLTRSLWNSQEARNRSTAESENPPQQALGIDLSASLANTASIDDLFYRENADFQLPVVSAGWSLGKFTKAGFSLEIMVERVGFDPQLGKVRSNNNLVTVATLPGSPTQPQQFEHWHDKEEILNYIDPCAFFGMFYHSKIMVKQSSGHSEKLKGNELYDDLLIKFYNKNVSYLDIRNEYNHSFNYFRNYGNSINIAFDASSAPSSLNYYASGWPILMFNNSLFAASNTSNKNIFKVQMPDGSGDNTLPLIFLSTGYLSARYPKQSKGKDKFLPLEVASGFTNEVAFALPNRNGLASVCLISGYTRLKYNKRFDADHNPPSSGTVIRAQDHLDNIFAPAALKIPFAGSDPVKWYVYDEEQYIDAISNLGFDSCAKIGVAKDRFSYTLFGLPFLKNTDNKSIRKETLSLSGETIDSEEGFLTTIVRRFEGTLTKDKLLLAPTATYPETQEQYLDIKEDRLLGSNFKGPDLDDLVAITFSAADYTAILTLCNSSFLAKYRVYLGVSNKEQGTDNGGAEYTRAILVVRGFENNGGAIQVKEVSTGIKIYANGNI